MDSIIESIERAEFTNSLTKEEIINILNDDEHKEALYKAADRVRKKYMGDEVHLRGLIEFSNICKRNCMYCGLRSGNKNIKRYRLMPDEIIELARKGAGYGYKTFVLQSGEDDFYTVEKMQYIISSIKKFNVAVTVSIGEKTFEEYKAYREVGADRYLIRIETTDKNLYDAMDPNMSHENRKRCLSDLKKLGYEVGSGSLVGLPNQTIESIADDILFFKEIGADMIGIGPFIPNGDTPLKDAKGGDFHLSLKVMALTRILLKDINIPATTAMETLDKNGRIIALQAGANVVMPNVTEGEYRKLYALYPGKICVSDTPAHCRGCITGKITGIGRFVSKNKGYRDKDKNVL
ncbi:biotin synthase [Clostridium acidisoli DSM 12555]|uniref:Biotin synthase n=1 Tax=Clostridium acidisoli DSM 12555 TaxID=1121291 RepID=A0A1W1X268_9CLOT|nr:[FeFe] hydrogenase H-cluster radical SAM maturase HydE [Clostridium acidisoli]SMC18069.1 biotin synthase [Clostridium acidisoli DSM 12555]